jgi:hypothetical protein
VQKSYAILLLAAFLAGCGMVGALVDGVEHVRAVETARLDATGIRPAVGFNWNNGRLISVTVTFPRLYEDKPLRDVAEAARGVVIKEFGQTPDAILLAFNLRELAPGESAQADQTS